MKTLDGKSLSLNSSQAKALEVYLKELNHFNKTIPLYSRRQKDNFCQEMILDSLLAGSILLKDCSHRIIADIGSGAGFPGIVLAVLDPLREFWLFEPNRKKAAFLEYAGWKMNLKNIQVRDIPIQQEKTALNCTVSKAFLSLHQRLTLTRTVFEQGAYYYHLQSSGWEKQWQKSPAHIQAEWRIKAVKQYKHPLFSTKRVLLRTDLLSNNLKKNNNSQ